MHLQFPILPDSKADLDSMLSAARRHVKDYLLAALHAVFQKFTAASDPAPLDVAQKHMLRLMDEEARDRTENENLIVLQASLFFIMAKETSGPGKNQSIIAYGFAHTIASRLNLHYNEEPDPREVLKQNGRRAWLMLITLERWHSVSMVDLAKVHESNVKLHLSDRKLLGEPAYHLFREFVSELSLVQAN